MNIKVAKLPRFGVYLYLMCFMGRPHEPLGPVKIGITGNVQSRISSVQTGCHQRLELLAAFNTRDRDIARRFESEMHDLGSRYRLHGEWFDIDPLIALEVACGVFRLILDETEAVFPDDGESINYQMGRVGLLHFEGQVKDLHIWRNHYAENSNVTAMSKTA